MTGFRSDKSTTPKNLLMTTKKPFQRIDVQQLRIVDEPYRSGRCVCSKYDEIFSQLQKGQRLVCQAGHAGKLGNSLKKWLAARGQKAPLVRARERCDDGQGGVWWLEKPPATVWQPLAAVDKPRKSGTRG